MIWPGLTWLEANHSDIILLGSLGFVNTLLMHEWHEMNQAAGDNWVDNWWIESVDAADFASQLQLQKPPMSSRKHCRIAQQHFSLGLDWSIIGFERAFKILSWRELIAVCKLANSKISPRLHLQLSMARCKGWEVAEWPFRLQQQ